MVKFCLCAVITGTFLWACSENVKHPTPSVIEKADSTELVEDTLELIEEEVLPETADELFNDFFFNFASDSKFQNERIKFPLKSHNGNETMMLSREDWNRFNRFSSQEYYAIIYEREQEMELQKDTSVNAVSIEWIYLHDECIERFNFRRTAGKWMLTDIENEVMTQTPNGNFLKFYTEFANDSISLHKVINFPLKFTSCPEDETEDTTEEYLSEDEWLTAKDELPIPRDIIVNIDYGQSSISLNRKVLLIEGLSNGLFVKFKFDKKNGQWRLIEIEN